MDVIGKCVAIIFSLMILAQAYLVRRYVGTWLFPACIFGLFWFAYTFFPLVVLFWVPVDPYATGFIFLCTVAFSLGSLPFEWKAAFRRNDEKRVTAPVVYGSAFLKKSFYLCVLLSLAFIALNMFAQGFSIADLLFNLFASARAYTDIKYSGDLKDTNLDQFSMVFAYLGAILGGFVYPSISRKTERLVNVTCAFLPAVLVAVTQSAKGLLFLCIALFCAGVCVHHISAGKLRLFGKGAVKSLSVYVAIVIVIVTLAFLARGLSTIEDQAELADRLVYYYTSYSCSHVYAFSDWFASITGRPSALTYERDSISYGFYTFTTIVAKLGSHKAPPPGIYDEYFVYGDLLTGNIYTVFRGLILDFGLIGSVLYMVLAGLLLHWNYRSLLLKRRPAFTVAIFVFMIGYIYMSFIVSALIWLNFYVAFLLLWIILRLNTVVTERSLVRWS